MTELWQDLGQLTLGTVLAPMISLLPGLALLWVLERFGFERRQGWESAALAALIGVAIFPALDALLIRFAGLSAVTLLHLLGAILGLLYAFRLRWTFQFWGFSAAGLWWALAGLSAIDIPVGQGINQSLVVIDLVKHAAVVEAIVRDGLPLTDPFFNRAERAGYYYYYYLWGAQVQWLGGAYITPRLAYTATLIWTGPAFVALLWNLCCSADLIRPGRSRRVILACIGLCFVAGGDFPAMLWRWAATGIIEQQTDSWTEEIRFALTSMMWTPHHLASLIAVWVGLICAVLAASKKHHERYLFLIGAGCAFASAFGMSLWITLTAVLSLAAWMIVNCRRNFPVVLTIILSGAIASFLSGLQLADILIGRHSEGIPVAPTVRMILWLRADFFPVLAIPLLLLLPTVYAIEFGVFAYGAALYRKLRPPVSSANAASIRSLLLFTAGGGLFVASFLHSTILNNDLGWRAPWFAELAAMVWTASVIQHMGRIYRPPPAFVGLLLLGVIPNVYDMVGLRAIRPPTFHVANPYANQYPVEDRSLRRAYLWANEHLPQDWVLQHNPLGSRRAWAFGVYGTFRTGVADREATLFGAAKSDVDQRIAHLRPIFEKMLDRRQIISIAKNEKIDALVFSSKDPVWRKLDGPPATVICAWRDRQVCIAPIDQMVQP